MSTTSERTRSVVRSYSRTTSSSSNASGCENLPPRTLARVGREVRDLHKKPPEGIRLVVDAETGCTTSLSELTAEIEGPVGTPFENRFFQLKLVLPSDFPSSPPRGFFLTKIYHPNVDMCNGAICVNTLKRDWTQETTFAHVLSVIRCLLIVPFPESSLNDEAGRLFMDSYEEFARRARLMADVHGRAHPSSKSHSDTESSPTKAPVGVLTESSSSLGLTDGGRSRVNIQRKENKKLAAQKKSKKKGLKRL